MAQMKLFENTPLSLPGTSVFFRREIFDGQTSYYLEIRHNDDLWYILTLGITPRGSKTWQDPNSFSFDSPAFVQASGWSIEEFNQKLGAFLVSQEPDAAIRGYLSSHAALSALHPKWNGLCKEANSDDD